MLLVLLVLPVLVLVMVLLLLLQLLVLLVLSSAPAGGPSSIGRRPRPVAPQTSRAASREAARGWQP